MTNLLSEAARNGLKAANKVLVNDQRLDVFMLIADRSAVTFAEIMEGVPGSRARIASHLSWLVRENLVEKATFRKKGLGRVRSFKVTEQGRELLGDAQ